MSNIPELAKLAAGGDDAAFGRFYELTKNGVWFTCKSLLKNEENARDIMQDTYLAAFEKLASLSDFSGVQSWLNKIAANKCRNFIKSKANSALAEDSEELLENIPDDSLIPEEYVADEARRRIIMEIIEKALSVEQFRTIILYYFNEMTAAEIAELMDVHEKTVLYRLKVARAKIKEAIMRYEEENKEKLHGVVFIPTLTRLFRAEAESTPVPNIPLEFHTSPNTQNFVPSEQAASAAQQGGKAMLNTLKAKIIAGACAAVVVGGGVTAGVIIANNSKDKTESKPSYSTNTSKPAASLEQSIAHVNTPEPVLTDWEYEDIEGGIAITSYLGSDEYVTVPAEIDGKKVLEIADGSVYDYVFHGYGEESPIKEITLPEGMTRIGDRAFVYLDHLKTVHIPDTVTSIGDGAFMGCPELENVTIPEGATVLNYVFSDCTSLSELTLPESAERLFNTFGDCSNITSIVIPANALHIEAMFENCTGLKDVTFAGNKLTVVGLRTFKGCTSLESIVIPDGVVTLDSYTFSECTSLKSVTLPEGLEEIWFSAFENCSALTSLEIPDSVTRIDTTAFEGCTNIKVTYKGKVYDYNHLNKLFALVDQIYE